MIHQSKWIHDPSVCMQDPSKVKLFFVFVFLRWGQLYEENSETFINGEGCQFVLLEFSQFNPFQSWADLIEGWESEGEAEILGRLWVVNLEELGYRWVWANI